MFVETVNDSSLSSNRHFSAYPLSSHLHQPRLKLVSNHPLLSVWFKFLRVPGIYDGFEWKYYMAQTTSVSRAISDIADELGLIKSVALTTDTVPYEIIEVWVDGSKRSKFFFRSAIQRER